MASLIICSWRYFLKEFLKLVEWEIFFTDLVTTGIMFPMTMNHPTITTEQCKMLKMMIGSRSIIFPTAGYLSSFGIENRSGRYCGEKWVPRLFRGGL